MTTTDAERFGICLAGIAEIYDRRLSDATIVLYFRALQDFPIEIVEGAFDQFLKSDDSRSFPRPGQIRSIVEGTQAERDAHAWLTLEAAIRRVGIHQSVIVEDRALAAAIVRTFGSWVYACQYRRDSDMVGWSMRRKDFIAAYSIARRQGTGGDPVLLAGLCEQENRQSGFLPPRTWYGAVLADGRIESRRLDVNKETGLPAASLRDALALPEPQMPKTLALPAPDDEKMIDIRAALANDLAALGALSFESLGKPLGSSVAELTDVEYEQRIRKLRQQAVSINADSDLTTSEPVHPTETGGDGYRADRAADSRRAVAGTDDGVPVRGTTRTELARGSGVADVDDPVRARGGRVRKRDPRRAGKLDHKAGQRGKTKGRVR